MLMRKPIGGFRNKELFFILLSLASHLLQLLVFPLSSCKELLLEVVSS